MTLEEALALTDGVYFDVLESHYHQIPRCSSSYLRRLAKNPAYAQLPCEESAAMEFGSAAHAYILQGEAVFNAEYIVMPEIAHHKNSNAYKECYANFQAAVNGKAIIEQKEYDKILGCADSIMEHPLASLFLMESFGQPEVTILWTDVETGIQMKCLNDRLPGKKTLAALD